ncbi:MAG: IS630 transposase-related protein [Betaproteobacteria bacterium]|nr:IS630 transposase-related protein [Betaproteobacteria bacterium]MCL2885354.1 IS630 transposase-related protein [Betaproteobacteria bacterium]
MAAYSQDLRDRVLAALARGERPSAIALRFDVSRSWVYQVRDRLHKQGQRTALPVGGYRRSRIEHLEQTLRSWIEEQADLTLAEMCDRLAGMGVEIKIPALWHQLDKWGLSLKKNAARQRARRRLADTATRPPLGVVSPAGSASTGTAAPTPARKRANRSTRSA